MHFYRDFGNTYNLYWTDCPEMVANLPKGAERITRARELELCRRERNARKDDPSFSGYADYNIFPAVPERVRNSVQFADAVDHIIPLLNSMGRDLRHLVTAKDNSEEG